MSLWSEWKRLLFRTAAVLAIVMAFALPARALTIHDLIALSHAGLSDQVLIALIQTDQTIYGVDAGQVLELKKAGVSQPVILALLKNGRQASPPPSPAAVEPAPAPAQPSSSAPAATAPVEERAPAITIIGDHRSQAEQETTPAFSVVVVESSIPVFVPVVVGRGDHRDGRRGLSGRPGFFAPQTFTGFGRFINDGFVTGSRPNIGGSLKVDGWRVVTPTVVPAHVRGQH